jgi:hypothetical protein
MPKQSKLNNQGQVLLIVVISLAVLLGVGLSISSGTLSSITRTSRTDSLQKVTAAAEGGLESYLLKTDDQLKQVLAGTSTATQNYNESNTKATITVSKVSAGDTGITFDTLDPGEVATFYFADDPSTVTKSSKTACIKISTDTPNPEYILNVIVRNPNTPAAFKSVSAVNYDATATNNFLMEKYIYSGTGFARSVSPSTCTGGYQFTDAALLRIHPLTKSLSNLNISVVTGTETSDTNLKNITQGYRIISKGEFISSGDATVRTIDAVKYLDSPSNMFDYAAFIDF